MAAARSKAEAERRAVEEGWVLGPGETLLSRLNDLKSAEYAAARRGTPMFADRWEREMAWLREVVLATAEGRAPNRPRHEPHEDRQWW